MFERPRWVRDVERYLSLKPQFVLSGNVRDLHLMDVGGGAVTAQPLLTVLAAELRMAGYAYVFAYDPVQGFRPLPRPGEDPGGAIGILTQLGLQPAASGTAPVGLDLFAETLSRLVSRPGEPIALITDRFASRGPSRRPHHRRAPDFCARPTAVPYDTRQALRHASAPSDAFEVAIGGRETGGDDQAGRFSISAWPRKAAYGARPTGTHSTNGGAAIRTRQA
jgi:hypothetical protein